MSEKTAGESSRRTFLKIGSGLVVGAVVAAVATDALLGGKTTTETTTSVSTQTGPITTVTAPGTTSTVTGPGSLSTTTVTGPASTLTSTATSTVTSTATTTVTNTSQSATTPTTNQQSVFLMLSTSQAAELGAMISTLIPEDSTGPGGKTAGAIYFIDRQLAADYGKNGNMYNKGPFVTPGLAGPITVGGVTYSGGSMITLPTAGTQYQYGMLLSDFWRYGLDAFQTYCNTAYGGNFETLSATNQVAALTDLANNKPTSFNKIVPVDFFREVFFMTWCGFLMDPLYGGNQGMVGWDYTGFTGTNTGNFYGEGYTSKQLMVMTTPVKLKPASLAQFQQAALGS